MTDHDTEQHALPPPAEREYDLVGDVVFEPPLPPEELRRRFGYGISIEERLAQVRRQLAEDDDGFGSP
jgi:hypothetical protein